MILYSIEWLWALLALQVLNLGLSALTLINIRRHRREVKRFIATRAAAALAGEKG